MWSQTPTGKSQALSLHKMGKAYGCRPTEILRDTDFRYMLDQMVLDVGSADDRDWEMFLALGKRPTL